MVRMFSSRKLGARVGRWVGEGRGDKMQRQRELRRWKGGQGQDEDVGYHFVLELVWVELVSR